MEGSQQPAPNKPASFLQRLNAWVEGNLTPIPFVQKIMFVHNLFITTKAGLSIVQALSVLGQQTTNKRLRAMIAAITNQVEKGRQLSEVLAEFPKMFPPIYVSMVAAGEAAGKLESSLQQISSQMKKSRELTAHVKGALIYPAVILVAMTGIGIEMVVFVLPKIIVLFDDFGAALPLPTRLLVATVKFGEQYALGLLLFGGALLVFLVWFERQRAVRPRVHRFNLRLPIIGAIIKKINVARFTLTLSSLLQSTVPIIEAVRITATVETNLAYRAALTAAAETLKKGKPLSEALMAYPKLFAPLVCQMVLVGEETGEVEKMLGELAQFYTDEVDQTMKNFSTVIEPLIILFLGAGVAAVAVAVIMPMYSLAQSF